eukprot:TRINITY_DN12576_c0_g1_i1.p1 TRINITY_DN12576_c0_g1~~TRINITY_DN12576_c0_g1_i1.p1  ORF type:complete len:182 (-),score=39.33 TRINITY_DN12576_c0_g1_i1:217-762(-)
MRCLYRENKERFQKSHREYYIRKRKEVQELLKSESSQVKERFEIFFGIVEPSEWYDIPPGRLSTIMIFNTKIFTYIKLFEFLEIVYPNISWNRNDFKTSISAKWNHPKMVREFMESIKGHLNIQRSEDWYTVSKRQVGYLEGGKELLGKFKSLYKALMVAYPSFPWVKSKFSCHHKKSSQK